MNNAPQSGFWPFFIIESASSFNNYEQCSKELAMPLFWKLRTVQYKIN